MNGWDMKQNCAQSNRRYVVGLRSSVSTSVHQEGKQENSIFPPPSFSPDEEWVKEYMKQFGQEPSFF